MTNDPTDDPIDDNQIYFNIGEWLNNLNANVKLTTTIDLNILSELSGVSIDDLNLMIDNNYIIPYKDYIMSSAPGYDNVLKKLYLAYYKYTYSEKIFNTIVKLNNNTSEEMLLIVYELITYMKEENIKFLKNPDNFILSVKNENIDLFDKIFNICSLVKFQLYSDYVSYH